MKYFIMIEVDDRVVENFDELNYYINSIDWIKDAELVSCYNSAEQRK